MGKKDLISLADLTREEILQIFALTQEIKERWKKGESYTPLQGKSLAMVFHKPSARTRVSFEVGMFQLGGQALYLSDQEIQMGRRESVGDVARVLSRYVEGIMIRTFDHNLAMELARYATVPVINGLTDFSHPCQILADIYTIKEKRGRLEGIKVAYIGDGNNVAHSWLYGAPKVGIDLSLATPKGYAPQEKVVEVALKEAAKRGTKIELLNDPFEAVSGADVIYTDVWASMGQEAEREIRLKVFRPYQVNKDLLKKAKSNVLVMHCLPAHRGEEITDEVINGEHSIVFDETENRLHVQKGILVYLLA